MGLRKTFRTSSVALLSLAWTLSGQPGAEPGQAQPHATNQRSLPNSVILRGGTGAQGIQRLHVARQYELSSVRANPHVALGEAQLDFTPLLNNPKALPNVALKLHALSQHVQVQEESSQVSEVDQGLVIHSVLSYRVLPGKCADAGARAQLAEAGGACFTRATASERIAEFSTPGHLRYVADPARRQAAIAAFQRTSAQADADATRQIAGLRKALADPAQRSAITAQVGQAEAARMSTLNDDQLKEEVINSATQRYEETMFVPRVQSAQYEHATLKLKAAPDAGEIAAGQQLLRGTLPEQASSPSNYPRLMRVVPASSFHSAGSKTQAGGDQVTDLDLGTYIYLTGFTLGHDYEWSLQVDTTINWCVVGCSSTYSVQLYAGFNYGFGLRFPIQTQLAYHNVEHPNSSAEARLTANFKPIEGAVADFESTGLSSDQLFDGKELVAQVGADAGFNYNLPVVGGGGMGFSIGVNFTDLLPAPYTHGHFLPPAPGTHGIDTPYVFDSIDLLGGLLNFGAVGGQVFPAVDINLHSNKLEFTLNDEVSKRQTRVTSTGQTVNLGVNPSRGNDSHFSFGNPVYNLGFTLTPGIDARLFVDVAVWSNNWDWPVWFPQLAVDLPPGGIDFGCHAGTTCVLDFQPEHQAGMAGGLLERLASEGCTKQGSMMNCTGIRGYQDCVNAVNSHSLLGVQSCNPGVALNEEQTADRTLTGGGCQRNNGKIGDYLCPVKGMAGLCEAMLKNGAVSSCGALVPASTDEILKRGGCTDKDKAGVFVCPSSMMGLCQLYVKNGVILSCAPGR